MVNTNSRAVLLFCGVLLLLSPQVHSQNIISVIDKQEKLSMFADAIIASGLDAKLSEQGPFTVFAPSNEHLRKELSGRSLSSPATKNLLLNHIITGYATERNMKVMSKMTSLGGITLVMKENDRNILVNGILINKYNVKAENGVIHIIDGVLK